MDSVERARIAPDRTKLVVGRVRGARHDPLSSAANKAEGSVSSDQPTLIQFLVRRTRTFFLISVSEGKCILVCNFENELIYGHVSIRDVVGFSITRVFPGNGIW